MGADTFVLIAIVAFVSAGVVVAAGLAVQRRWPGTLEEQFAAEGDPIPEPSGSWEAGSDVAQLHEGADDAVIRPLTRANHHRLSEEWSSVQALYLDDPELAVEQADGLIEEVMRARGIPPNKLGHYGDIVDRYRAAHAIATATREAGVDRDGGTESLRLAFVHYRALFAELLESPAQFRGEQRMARISRAS